ncbi:hypothetical protein BGW37DRAFT_495357 [Umbelopsis sp. PMI_123]|nr:hypothetical protein BGW37DRAFT_495357 [Umbelopsis sp. PMI_123]
MSILQTVSEDKALLAATVCFGVVGALFAAVKAYSFIKMILDVLIVPGISLSKFGAGKGSWAVITGASDGIGKEFAMQLAKKKFNLLLVSRTESKLQELAKELEQAHGVQTKTYAMDFTKGESSDYSNLGEIINTIEVGVLVNNVGTNHDIPTLFDEESEETIANIVEVNINGTLKTSKLVIPQMKARRSGLILNLGSFSGLVATPYLSVYSAGKAFLSTWSQALGTELAGDGIVVEHVNTYFVVSAMSKIRKPTFMIPLPKPYVASVLAKIGVAGGSSVPYSSTPYLGHALLNWVINNLATTRFVVKQNYAMQKDIRRRALRKREREAQQGKKTA